MWLFFYSAIHQRLITSATLNPTARKRSKNRNMFILSPTPSVSFVFKVIVQITVVKYVMAGHCAISQWYTWKPPSYLRGSVQLAVARRPGYYSANDIWSLPSLSLCLSTELLRYAVRGSEPLCYMVQELVPLLAASWGLVLIRALGI